MAAAPTLQSMFSPLGKYRPFEVDEGSPAFPPGEGGPPAVDEGWFLTLTPAAPTLPQGRAKEWGFADAPVHVFAFGEIQTACDE